MRIDTYKFKLVKSTNDTAISLIKKKNKKKGIIIAEKQISGRGQYGREWISYKGNLFVSIFFNLENLKLSIKQLTKINAKIIIKALSSYYKKKIFVKKPNDIIINKKKISGILQEIIHHNNVRYIIVGIGLNLVKSPKIKGYPTTNLYDLTKKKINIYKFSTKLKKLYEEFIYIKKK